MCEAVEESKKLHKKLLFLYIYNPTELLSSTVHESHLKFINEGLSDLDLRLQNSGGHIVYRYGSPESVFRELHEKHHISAIFMHDDVENASIRASLLNFEAWASAEKVAVNKWRQDGVGIEHCDGTQNGESESEGYMSRPSLKCPDISSSTFANKSEIEAGSLKWSNDVQLGNRGIRPGAPKGGTAEGIRLVDDIISGQEINKHDSAAALWAKLSIYVAWGHVSIRFLFQTFENAAKDWDSNSNSKTVLYKLVLEPSKGITAHIRTWVYFCQKSYERPGLELKNDRRDRHHTQKSDSSLERDKVEKLKAWMTGATGCPLADAIMRKAARFGWIEFNLWSEAVCFAFSVLRLDWHFIQPVVAQLSLSGAHGYLISYMQEVCLKNSRKDSVIVEFDKACRTEHGRKLIISVMPSFSKLPSEHISRPWLMNIDLQKQFKFFIGKDYPAPIYKPPQLVRSGKRKYGEMAASGQTKTKNLMTMSHAQSWSMTETIDLA